MPEQVKRCTFYSQDEVERMLRRHRPGLLCSDRDRRHRSDRCSGFIAGWLIRGVCR